MTQEYNIIFARLAWNSQHWTGFDLKGYENKGRYQFKYVADFGYGHEWWNFYDYPGDFYYGAYGGPNKAINYFKKGLILFTSQDIFTKKHYLVGFYGNAEYGQFSTPRTYFDSLDEITKNKILSTFSNDEGKVTFEEMKVVDTPIFKSGKDNSAYLLEPVEFDPTSLGVKKFGMQSVLYVGDGALISKKATKEVLQKVVAIHKSMLEKPENVGKNSDIKAIIQKTEAALGKYFSDVSEQKSPSTANDSGNMQYGINDFPKQIILYGPPGTGKTYSAFLRAHEILFGEPNKYATFSSIKKKLIDSNSNDEIDAFYLTWADTIFLAFEELKSDKATVSELKRTDIVVKVSAYKHRERNIGNTLWSILQQYSLMNSKTVHYQHKNGSEYFDKDESSKWFITESGKEYFKIRSNEIQSAPRTTDAQLSFVTFHQSYSYEEFIEGYRPVKDDEFESGSIGYELRDGIFKRICNLAKEDPDNNYVLIIDEINRGNISKIFGELITLIEDNKRISGNEEIFVTLPYSRDEFGVPANVYIIGTMNSTDKSIALVDIALRRRFRFEKISPEYKAIINESAREILKALNENICALKNSDFVIGHSYFMKIPENDTNNGAFKEVFISQVLPLIEEYFYNDWEALATILGKESIATTTAVSKLYWNDFKGIFESNNNDDEKILGRILEKPEKIADNVLALYTSEKTAQ